MMRMETVVKILRNWLGMTDADEFFYIGGSDVLPPPLSAEEEKDLLIQFDNGSEEARAILIERNLRLVVYIAKKFESAGVNVEDLISI